MAVQRSATSAPPASDKPAIRFPVTHSLYGADCGRPEDDGSGKAPNRQLEAPQLILNLRNL